MMGGRSLWVARRVSVLAHQASGRWTKPGLGVSFGLVHCSEQGGGAVVGDASQGWRSQSGVV